MARTLIERGFDPERIVKIYNGMEFNRPEGEVRPCSLPPRDLRRGDRGGGCALWHRGASDAVKDIATTVRGFAEALKTAPQLRLFIAGDGEDADMLKKLCDQLGVRERVTFCGWVSPVMPFFRAMDINLLSSVSETFPYSILEGVCAGCATICSDVGGMPELIDTGENGYIFPVETTKARGIHGAACERCGAPPYLRGGALRQGVTGFFQGQDVRAAGGELPPCHRALSPAEGRAREHRHLWGIRTRQRG
ncbi:MAG: glycosyltransferase [Butyricicoccaceae bacterium]